MRIAITGASGHIGSNLCRALISEGHEVRALINHTSKSLDGLPVEKIQGNIVDKKSLEPLITGSDIVIHLAATISIRGINEQDLLSININGTKNILEVINKIPVKIVQTEILNMLKLFEKDERTIRRIMTKIS